MGAHELTAAQRAEIEKLEASLVQQDGPPPDTLTISTLEEEIDSWLRAHGQDDLWQLASDLAHKNIQPAALDRLYATLDADTARAALVRIAASMEIANLLNEIESSTSRISDLVRAIKEYTYMDQSPVQNVDIVKSLETTLTILNHKLKRGVTVKRDYQRVPFLVNSFGSELNQVWTNVIDNAIDAMGGQGELRLRTYREDACVVVEIADNGPGIPEKVQPHIFEPFFTTKGVGQGTGLGTGYGATDRAQASWADSGQFKAGRYALSDMASAGRSTVQLAFGFCRCAFDFRIAKAIYQMVIHHPHCLHERIADRWADKFKSAFKQVAAHLVGLCSSRLYLR